jgi:hypothetical protein
MRPAVSKPSTSVVKADEVTFRCNICIRDETRIILPVVTWNPQRFLAPYITKFVNELVAYARQGYPGRDFTRRAPALPQPPGPGKLVTETRTRRVR